MQRPGWYPDELPTPARSTSTPATSRPTTASPPPTPPTIWPCCASMGLTRRASSSTSAREPARSRWRSRPTAAGWSRSMSRRRCWPACARRPRSWASTNVEVVQARLPQLRAPGRPGRLRLLAQRATPPARLLEGARAARVAGMLRPGGVLRLHDLVYYFEPHEAGGDRGLAGGRARAPGGRLDPRRTGDARPRGIQHLQLAAGAAARTRRLRHPARRPTARTYAAYTCVKR